MVCINKGAGFWFFLRFKNNTSCANLPSIFLSKTLGYNFLSKSCLVILRAVGDFFFSLLEASISNGFLV